MAASPADSLLTSAPEAKTWLKQQSELLGHGQPVRAVDVAIVADAHLADLDVQHRAGSLLSMLGQHDLALRCLNRALQLRPRFHYSEVEMGLAHARAGRPDEARNWFDMAIQSRPDYLPSYMHAARIEREQRRPFAALPYLQAALALNPAHAGAIRETYDILATTGLAVRALDVLRAGHRAGVLDDSLHSEMIRTLCLLGWYDELIDLTSRLSPRPGSALAAQANVEAGQATIARAYDADAIVMRAAARQRSRRWLDAPTLARRLRDAIETATPLSFIRVGDGEGRFLAQADPDLPFTLAPHHRRAIRDVIWFNWFGTEPDSEQLERMPELIRMSRATIETADILGTSDARRLATDRGHFGYLAYLDGVVEEAARRRPEMLLVDALVHNPMHEQDPFLKQMLHGVRWLGIVSPHPALGARLRAHLGIADGRDFHIPGEMRLPNDPGLARGRGHFPGRFDELMATLDVPFRGAVVLVAGGLLGKIYCERIRDRGGIAIDIGSLADAWMGYATRPGQYRNPEFWRLPT